MRKFFFLGLDSAPPKTIYENYGVNIPELGEIIEESARWIMRSCHPPITIPAWMVMFTGKTPGELGIYGFRHRKPGDANFSYIVNYSSIREETLWDTVGLRGGTVGLFGVPPTWPPRPVKGFLVTDFMTPHNVRNYAFPPWLRLELERVFGKIVFDVKFRREDKLGVRNELFDMTRQHIEIVKYLVEKKQWDAFIYVEIGVDRIHHAFWKYFDVSHPRYKHDEKLSRVIPEYYSLIDEGFKKLKKSLPKDTVIIVASDHGIKPMTGAIAINEWLIQQGYLRLKERNAKPGTDLSKDMIKWDETLAWGWGGYYSRIFLNLKGREPYGIVGKEEAESLIRELRNDITRIKGPGGEVWRNIAVTPGEVYPEVKGDPPDLIAYFDDLGWRAAGTIGWGKPYLRENDRGPDDAVHSWDGVFSVYDPEETLGKGMKGVISIDRIRDFILEVLVEKK